MTEELFLKDAYLRKFEAGVVEPSGREVILDRTAFYPGGGGQPSDKGTLGVGPVRARAARSSTSWTTQSPTRCETLGAS